MRLGSSPALPDISFEICGFERGTAGPGYPDDAVASMCYEALIPIVQSQAPILPDSPPRGVVTAFQAARDVVNGVQSAPGVLKGLNVPCAPLVLDAEQTLIHLVSRSRRRRCRYCRGFRDQSFLSSAT
jgi:hypothetical protein